MVDPDKCRWYRGKDETCHAERQKDCDPENCGEYEE